MTYSHNPIYHELRVNLRTHGKSGGFNSGNSISGKLDYVQIVMEMSLVLYHISLGNNFLVPFLNFQASDGRPSGDWLPCTLEKSYDTSIESWWTLFQKLLRVLCSNMLHTFQRFYMIVDTKLLIWALASNGVMAISITDIICVKDIISI